MSYVPAAWLPGAHAMTILARLTRGRLRLEPRRERWSTPDGDFVDVDRHGEPAAPVVVVCHGLEGSSRAPYVERLVAALRSRGLSAVAMNFRGCSGEENRLPCLYHSGETSDLRHVVERLAAERPGRPIGLAGFSLGGNVVAKYLGERGDDLPPEVRGGAVVSVPFDLAGCAHAIDAGRGLAALYRHRFLRTLKRKAMAKARRFPGLLEASTIARARTFADFDEHVTARLHAFANAQDYWERSSAGRYLLGVRRPLLAIAAEDDPMVPAASLPREAAAANPAVVLEVHPRGGHVGFVSGLPWRLEFFAEVRAAAFLAETMSAADIGSDARLTP